ncbi:MAG: DUF1080 domain-containing protein [Bryobacteraceae bacterium]|nr:DUF1080 domain-containing protein [Bryobacteraceae bacterium]
MRACIVILGMGLVAASGAREQSAAANTLTAAEKKEGWRLLFDGKTLNGWQARATSEPGTTGGWTVANGAIVCPGVDPGWLSSSEAFGDFSLKLDFRGRDGVNSGVFIRSQAEGQPHLTGYEVQIWDHQPAGFNTGSLVGSVKAGPAKILPDVWNTLEIAAAGERIRVALNGATVLDAADSKHTGAGLVGFQCQKDNRIEFRNIRVKPAH